AVGATVFLGMGGDFSISYFYTGGKPCTQISFCFLFGWGGFAGIGAGGSGSFRGLKTGASNTFGFGGSYGGGPSGSLAVGGDEHSMGVTGGGGKFGFGVGGAGYFRWCRNYVGCGCTLSEATEKAWDQFFGN